MPYGLSERINVEAVEFRPWRFVARWVSADERERIPFAGWMVDPSSRDERMPFTTLAACRERLARSAAVRVQSGYRKEDIASILAWFRALPRDKTHFVDEECFCDSLELALSAADLHDDAYQATKAMEGHLFCVSADDGLLKLARERIDRRLSTPDAALNDAARALAWEAFPKLRSSSAVWRDLEAISDPVPMPIVGP